MPSVFITRELNKNSIFKKELTKVGFELISQSLVTFSPTLFYSIPPTDWIFFYSKNGVKFFFENAPISLSKNIKWAVMGKGTATALLQQNIQADFIGNGQPKATAEAFLKIAKNQQVLFPRAKNSKKSVQNLLESQLIVHDLVVYENAIKRNFSIPNCDYLVFTSPLNATAYFQKYSWQSTQKIIAIGKTTANALKALGIHQLIIANTTSEKGLTEAVLTNYKSMSEKYAVIDLGTNTFHLLVAEKQVDNQFKELHRQRFFVKLAEEGIETIGDAPIQRGFHALKTFRETLDKFGITKVKAIGTAALRTATNGPAFVQSVKEQLDIQIELISGNREAELIYKGVHLAVPFQEKKYLIMDIGGGSVEFIIANKNKVFWAQSFPIGVGVLYKNFHHTEPILTKEVNALNVFLERVLSPLYKALERHPANILVGASGTFDVLEFILAKEQNFENHAFVKVADFEPLYQLLLHSTVEERLALKDIPDTRADMIVVAIILIDFIIKKAKIEDIIVSNFAMKEGILSELMA